MVTLGQYVVYLNAGHPLNNYYFKSPVSLNEHHQEFYRLAEVPKPDDRDIAVFPASDANGGREQPELVHVPRRQHLDDLMDEVASSGKLPAIPAA